MRVFCDIIFIMIYERVNSCNKNCRILIKSNAVYKFHDNNTLTHYQRLEWIMFTIHELNFYVTIY